MRAYERLLKYVVVHTASDDTSSTVPSTMRQFDLANLLVEEMKAMNIENVYVDEHCYVYGTVPATCGYENAPAIMLMAHLDTIPDFSGENVKPCVIENYDGQDVVLGDSGRVLSLEQFPHLASLKGRTLITTDGTTVLGADDKAGIAECLTVVERLEAENIPHGKICLSFAPDEEIGHGAALYDIEGAGPVFGYTLDGGAEGEIEFENFNACEASFEINGFNVHPGSAKNTMINAYLVAFEINSMLPAAQIPAKTEGYEGFYHLYNMAGSVEKVTATYIVRDHDIHMFEARKATLLHIEKTINEKYGAGTVKLTLRHQYSNMLEKIEPCMHLIENAKAAATEVGITPVIVPIRGGTDGAQLSFRGLPCPNLGTGGYAFHGPYEHITAEGMDLAVDMVIAILRRYADMR